MTSIDQNDISESPDTSFKTKEGAADKNTTPSEGEKIRDDHDRERKLSHRKDKKERDRHSDRGRERGRESEKSSVRESRRNSRKKRRHSYSSSRERKSRDYHGKKRDYPEKTPSSKSQEKDGSPEKDSRHRRDHKKSERKSPKDKVKDRDSKRERDKKGRKSRSRSRSSHRSRRSRRSTSRPRRYRRRSHSRRSHSRSTDRRHRSRSRSRSPVKKEKAVPTAAPVPEPPNLLAAALPSASMITQLMKQHPTASLQDILARMQMVNSCIPSSPATKPARELYVGNLPPSVTGPQLQDFLGTIVQQVGMTVAPGNPILSTWVSSDGHYAFCEFRSVEECNNALMLNGLQLLGQALKCGRPKSYTGPPQPPPTLSANTITAIANLGCIPNPTCFSGIPGLPAFLPSIVADPNCKRIIMMNIPQVLTEDQVRELVSPFGELKTFTLVVDALGKSSGNAIFEYEDGEIAEQAINGLNNLDIGGQSIIVQRAPAAAPSDALANFMQGAPLEDSLIPTPVLRLGNMVNIEELEEDEEVNEISEDVREECGRYGQVVSMAIPRPKDSDNTSGLGKIYVEFSSESHAQAAHKALTGRCFGGNTVDAVYYPLEKYNERVFE